MTKSILNILVYTFLVLFFVVTSSAQNAIIRATKPEILAKPKSFLQNSYTERLVDYQQPKGNSLTPDAFISHTEMWGEGVFVEDKSQITFKQNHKYCPFNEYFSYICGVTFTFLNEDMSVYKEFYLDLPPQTHSVSVMHDFSRNVFNTDSKFEFMVHIHYFEEGLSGPESVRDEMHILNEDGSRVRPIENWCDGAFLDYQSPEFCKLVLFRIYTENYINDENAKIQIEVYKPRPWTKEHTFEWLEILLAYIAPSYYFDIVEVAGIKYYFTIFYEKKWCIGYDDNGDPIPDPTNKFILTLYNLDYSVAKTMKFDLFGLAEHALSFSKFGLFSANMKYDISKNIYSTDGKFCVVYGMSRYNSTLDTELTDYYVVNEEGTILKQFTNPITHSWQVTNIEGFEDQVVMVVLGGAGGGAFHFLNAQSFTTQCIIPGAYESELLSMNLDRVKMGDNYQYVIGLGQAEIFEGKPYSGIMFFNNNGVKVNKVRFLLNEDVLLWQPIILGDAMRNVITNDGELCLMSFTKHQNQSGSGVFNSFEIKTMNDQTIAEFYPDAQKGNVHGAGFVYENGTPKKLYVTYIETNYDFINTDFYKLPLTPISIKENDKTTSSIIIYHANQHIIIESETEISSVEVFDILGRRARFLTSFEMKGEGAKGRISTAGWRAGVYIVSVRNVEGVVGNRKIMIS